MLRVTPPFYLTKTTAPEEVQNLPKEKYKVALTESAENLKHLLALLPPHVTRIENYSGSLDYLPPHFTKSRFKLSRNPEGMMTVDLSAKRRLDSENEENAKKRARLLEQSLKFAFSGSVKPSPLLEVDPAELELLTRAAEALCKLKS